MIEKLKAGYTLIISGEYGNVSGGYLKTTEEGVYPSCLDGDEIDFLKSYSEVFSNLEEQKILQLYSVNNGIVGMLGERCYDKDADMEYLNVLETSFGPSAFLSLDELNKRLENKNDKVYRKAYKVNRSDKYQFYTREFIKKNIGGSQ